MIGHALLARAIQRWLYEVRPLEPAVLTVAAVGMAVIALLACAVPARRATRIDAATVLKHT
jgi:ABC-type lipoprotein release transport system permease subunit